MTVEMVNVWKDETVTCSPMMIGGREKYHLLFRDVLISNEKQEVKIYRWGSFENLFFYLYGE